MRSSVVHWRRRTWRRRRRRRRRLPVFFRRYM